MPAPTASHCDSSFGNAICTGSKSASGEVGGASASGAASAGNRFGDQCCGLVDSGVVCSGSSAGVAAGMLSEGQTEYPATEGRICVGERVTRT